MEKVNAWPHVYLKNGVIFFQIMEDNLGVKKIANSSKKPVSTSLHSVDVQHDVFRDSTHVYKINL